MVLYIPQEIYYSSMLATNTLRDLLIYHSLNYPEIFINLLCTALCVHVQSSGQPTCSIMRWSYMMANNPLPPSSSTPVHYQVCLASVIGQATRVDMGTQSV